MSRPKQDPMIRRLRLQFVAVCMALVTAVVAVVVTAAFFTVRQNIAGVSRGVLTRVIQDDRPTLRRPGEDSPSLPYFTVSVWQQSGAYRAYITGGTYDDLENTEELTAILQECLSQNQPEGIIHSYHLRYLRQDNGLYQKVAFVDMSMEYAMLRQTLISHLCIAAAALLVLLAVSLLLSSFVIRPVERAWRQQRQFLSDASHELKTPLTVILSNAELLSGAALEERPARWADNIRSEARQMRSLVEEMLTLARADNMPAVVQGETSLSDAAEDCALLFEPVAFEAGKTLSYAIAPGVTVVGDADRLKRLISVLLDNAIKYGAAGGTVTLSLEKADRQARLVVSNPGKPIPPEQLSHLFERFYRADSSRGEQSGFGLGLSIAATIAREHRGTLRAESDIVSTRFTFTIPLKK
ncbi:sensor histidine kinase [Dysosmobacter sp.]|uniref:sensor histidine kinase n=1 Tax=Dysosmobacter sp. TaxID=2591382 RepID=UPI002A8BA54C|nr:HAMP domain-containing sensor histidine kinase [Dysosmobacter sp.]MDY3282215.1 HAMP domain-containing sensor histidine kinase [Dysosmobacter sp.]